MTDKPKFYTDANVPYEAVKQLRDHGADVVRCQDVGKHDIADEEHFAFAVEQERIVITCDNDFTLLHWQWIEEGREHFGIIYCRQPDLCSPKAIIENALLIFGENDGRELMKNNLWRV